MIGERVEVGEKEKRRRARIRAFAARVTGSVPSSGKGKSFFAEGEIEVGVERGKCWRNS